jgi:hypothetical protein
VKTTNPSNYSLNQKQVHLLKLAYKFRFVSSSLLARYFNRSNSVGTYKALETLKDNGYLNKHYDTSYNLQGKAATYYLTPKGSKYLRDQLGFNEDVLRSYYKNKSVGQPFIDHSLNVFKTYLKLEHDYPNSFNIYTKYELASFGNFPNPAPDIYSNRMTQKNILTATGRIIYERNNMPTL